MTNAEKKKYLNSYLNMQKEIDSKREMIEYIRQRELGKAITYSDMPKGTSIHDLSDYAADLDDIVRKYEECCALAVIRMKEITAAIDELDNVEERIILRSRYILGHDWEKIAEQLHHSWRHTLRIHGNALEHFEKMS